MQNIAFQVRKDDLAQTRWQESQLPEMAEAGQLLLRVDRFALTANNVTYGVYGDALGYWQFYPAADGWGVIPVWGFAEVIGSGVEGLPVGKRLFGYWPMARFASLKPKTVDAATVVEGAGQRQALNPYYNRYTRCSADAAHDPAQEDWHCVFRPLGLTGMMLAEHLHGHDFWGAGQVLLSSASSKTALATAHFLQELGGCKVVGLTSPGNLEFVRGLGCYDEVVSYERIDTLPVAPSLFVDMAGNGDIKRQVHQRFGDVLQRSIAVGGTHWSRVGEPQNLPGPVPEFYFVPDYIQQRVAEIGPEAFFSHFAKAWASLLPRVRNTVVMNTATGPGALETAYRQFLDGQADPQRGYIHQL